MRIVLADYIYTNTKVELNMTDLMHLSAPVAPTKFFSLIF